MKLKNAFLALALSCAVVVPLTACDDTSANIKSQKEFAVANMNANAVNILGSEIIDFYTNLNVPVDADASYIDTYQEAYDLIARFPDIQAKLNLIFETTTEYFNSVQNLEELFEVQDKFADQLNDVLRYTEAQKVADLALSINHAKNYLQENYPKFSPSNYSAKAFSQLEDLHDDILTAISTEKNYRVIDALVNNMKLVLPIEQQNACAENWITQIEDKLSDVDILYTYYENMAQVQALKSTAILAIEQATTEAEMEAIFHQLFIDVEKIQEYGSYDPDMEQQYLLAVANSYYQKIDFLMQQEFIASLPTYWGENWAQLVAQTAKILIEKAQSEYEIIEIYSSFFVDEINYICNDYYQFVDEMEQANQVLARVNNADVIMTAENKAGFDALVVKLQDVLDRTEDWDTFLDLLHEKGFAFSESMSDESIPKIIATALEDYYYTYSFTAQLESVLHSNYFFYADNAEKYKNSYFIYKEAEFGQFFFYNSIEQLMSDDFTEDQIVPFGARKIDVMIEELTQNLANVFVEVYGLTEEEAIAVAGVVSPNRNVFELVAQNKVGFMEAQTLEYKGIIKILAQPDKVAETRTKLLDFGTAFAREMYAINKLHEDLIVGVNTLLAQLDKDFNENTTYMPYFEDITNFSEKKEILEMVVDFFEFTELNEKFETYEEFAETYNTILMIYQLILDEFYLADDAVINDLPSAQKVYGMCKTVFLNTQADMLDEIATEASEKFQLNIDFYNDLDEIQQTLDATLEEIDASAKTAEEKSAEINIAYSVAIDALIVVMGNFVEYCTQNFITVTEFEALQEKQLELLLAIEPALAQYGVALTDSPATLEECTMFFGDIGEYNLELQNTAFLYNDFYLEVAVDSTDEVMQAITTYVENVLSAQKLSDLVNENDENIFDIAKALSKITTIFDVYAQDADETLLDGCSQIFSLIINIFLGLVEEAQQQMVAANADFHTLMASLDTMTYAYLVSDEMSVTIESFKQKFIKEIDYLDITNTQQNPLVTLTTAEIQSALAFVENLKTEIAHKQDIMVVAASDVCALALEFVADNPLWAELVFTNYWYGVIDNFFAEHDIDTTNLEASLAEKFQPEEVETILSFVEGIDISINLAKYSSWLNNAVVQEEYETYYDYLMETHRLYQDMNAETLANFLNAEEKLRSYKLSALNEIVEGFSEISAPLFNETYASLLDECGQLKAQVWQAESIDAIDAILDEFEDVISGLDDSEEINALIFAYEKSVCLKNIDEFELSVAYLFNEENQVIVKGLIADLRLAINSTEVDTIAELEAITNAFVNDINAVESLEEYFTYANAKVETFITNLEANKANYDFGDDFADVDEFILSFDTMANFIVLLNDSIADFEAQFKLLEENLESYLIPQNP